MQFNKAYNRQEFVEFLRHSFLPDDFYAAETPVSLHTQTKFTASVTKLGTCDSLDLVVYEIRHRSKNDARVGLSKEAFRVLADEWQDRALVIFVPEESNSNYRFSLITVDLDMTESGKLNKRYSNPRRYSYYLGKGIATHTPDQFLLQKGRVIDGDDLKNRFSVEVLTKAFYNELSDWYAWAVRVVRFPNKIDDTTDDDKYNSEATIRLVTRLIFVWFLKQKHLIPDEFFDEQYIADNLLDGFEPNAIVNLFGKSEESRYYKAILQNLFFAMLNSPITPEDKDTISERRFRSGRGDYDNNKLMRYESMFSNPKLFVELANKTVPFLNGGLFDCLDDKDHGNYIDGFSDREIVKRSLIVPDYLFFGDTVGKDIDLSDWYGDASKKKVSAAGIIDILKRYNFTVEENTPYDQEVSLDPELLGKVFENLLASYNPETKTTARKQTGSFYTPREIVQYMVDESIIAHLNKTVGKDLEPEYRKLVSYTDESLNLTKQQKESIISALYDCKVLDPACGSGAFPMGILQQMVHILSELDPSNEMWEELILDKAIQESDDKDIQLTEEEKEEKRRDIERSFNESLNYPDYARKLYLIENCIYGVDIQPIAIQISKLRFFISLVVDQKANNNPVENFGIRPLPNLEAKFVAANSLIGLKKNNSLFVTNIIDIEEKLQKANHKIFSAKTYKTKRKYRELLKTLRHEMVEKLADINVISNDQIEQLASWDMFDQNSFASFFDPEWMFGVSTGFDIVIGNPPYIQLQLNGGELGKMYEECGFQSFTSTGDIYCLFYERGHQLLKTNGHLCYITSNKWMRAAYGEKLRTFLACKTNPLLLIDFAGVKVFESATVDTNILLFEKAKNAHHTICAATNKQNRDSLKNLSVFVQQQGSPCDFSGGDSWVIMTPIEQSIKRKIESVGVPLKDWNIQINYGIKTGYNDAFIITSQKRDEILSNCSSEEERSKTDEIIRPILRGRDIKRYSYDWANLWLIWVPWHFPLHNDTSIQGASERAEQAFQAQYPALYKHLSAYKKELSARNKAETGIRYEWYALQRWGANYWEEFMRPKIIYREIGFEMDACIAPANWFVNNKLYLITGDNIEYLLAFLNSKVFNKIILASANLTGGKGVDFMEKVKVPREQSLMEAVVNTNDERQIDAQFNEFFGLTEAEKQFLSGDSL